MTDSQPDPLQTQPMIPHATPEQIAEAQRIFAEAGHVGQVVDVIPVPSAAEMDTEIQRRLADPNEPPAPPIPTQHAERVAEVATGTGAGMTSEAIAQLIAEARGQLGVTSAADPRVLEATAPGYVNALLAAQGDLKAQIDALSKQRALIQDIFRDMLAEHDELQVNGATVATYKQGATKRTIDIAQVEKLFPDTADNAELWTEKPGNRTLLFR